MPKFKLKKWVAAGLVLSLPYAAAVDAAGLGRLNVLSQLGQPFAAEIDLVNVTREELATLKASLATPAAYQAANLSFNPSLNALRLSIDKRPNGQPYIKANSFRLVAEPFLDLLIDLTWAGGKVTREYSALLDPPGMQVPAPSINAPVAEAPVPVTPATAATPPAAAEIPPPASSSVPAGKPVVAAPKPQPQPQPKAASASGAQVAVKSGDTLNAIASSNKPEGVSLEQMLIGIFRANPDAFYGNNINNLRAGKILTIPEREQLANLGQGEAAQEVRVHAGNWNAYRAKVADVAPAVADAAPASKGKITARVDDKAAPAAPKDVVVLSKGDAASGKAGKGGDRLRALEEDLAARDKALSESKERIAMLEKTLAEAKKLGEIKTAVTPPAAPVTKGTEKAPEKAPPKAEPPKVEPPKAEPPKAEPPKAEPPKAEPPKDTKEPGKAESPAKEEQPAAKADTPTPKKAAPPPPPPPEPDLMDTVMDNIVPIGGGAAALLAAGGGLWFMRRRKKKSDDDVEVDMPVAKAEPFRGNAATEVPGAVPAAEEAVSNVSDVVDPLDEAQVYIDHGRDAQAEDILKEAIVKFPDRNDIPVKLLEVYAARGDKDAFNALARQVHTSTGGVGDDWDRVVSMGYAIDPTNPLYPSSGNDVLDLTAGSSDASAGNIDLDLGDSPTVNAGEDKLGTTTDIFLDQGAAAPEAEDMNRTMVLTRDEPKTTKVEEPPVAMDFNIDLPESTPEPAAAVSAAPAEPAGNMMDFNIDLPSSSEPAKVEAPAVNADDGGLDFKVDLGGINLNLDDQPAVVPAAAPAPAAGGTHDAHWEDVQQKFDLARAYQEMGDKEGAMEILHEVVKEGDDGQKAAAQKLMDTLK